MNALKPTDPSETSNSSENNQCANNTTPFITRGMFFRISIYLVVTLLGWFICRHFSNPETLSLSMWNLAFLTCGVSGLASLLMGEYGAMRNNYMTTWMLGMMLRTGLPVLIVLAGRVNHTDWESRGIFMAIVVAFLLTLSLETVLSVNLLQERYSKTSN